MENKQLGNAEYNDAILTIYGANPVASVSESYKPKSQPLLPNLGKSKKIGSGDLNRETYKMMLAAKANANLKKAILKYEITRFKQLKVDLVSGKKSKKKKDKDLLGLPKTRKEASNTSISGWMKRLIKRMFDRAKGRLARWIKRSIKRMLGKKGIRFVRNILKPLRKFRARGGVRGFLFRNFKRLNLRILGRSRYLRLARFNRGGGVTGFARRRFFKAIQGAKTGGIGGAARGLFGNRSVNAVKGAADAFGRTKVGQSISTQAANVTNVVNKGTSAVSNFVTSKVQGVTSFASKTGDDIAKGATKYGDDFMAGLRAFGSGVAGIARKAVDPKTYTKIYDDVIGKPLAALGDATKKVIDDLATWVANSKMFRKLVESKIGQKVMRKLGQIVLKKLVMRLIIGLGTVMAIWDAIDAWLKGDYEGATIKLISAIPVFGIPALIVDIARDLFPETWESIVSGMTGADKETRNANIKKIADITAKGYEDYGTGYNDAGFGAGFGVDGAAAEGMKTDDKPQMVIVGDGGENEWIVPPSKLLYWLGTKSGIELLNPGVFNLFATSRAFLKGLGLSTSIIPEPPPGSPAGTSGDVKVKKPNSIGDFGKSIVEFITKGFEEIAKIFKSVIDKFLSFLPDLSGMPDFAKDLLRRGANFGGKAFAAFMGFLLGGGSAQAASSGGGNTPANALSGGGFEYTDPDSNTTITVTSQYGMRTHPIYGTAKMHGGTDISATGGTPLRAISDGEVVDSDSLGNKGWGNFLVFKDDKGIFHLYGHMQGGYKRGGQVKKGDIIGKVGSTGASTGPHLHWEAGTGWNGGVITGKFDPLSRYTAEQPFFTKKAEETSDDDAKSTASTPPPAATPPPKQQMGRAAAKRRSDSAARARREAAPPPVAPLNKKDTASALEEFGTMDEDNNQQVAVIEVPVTRTEYVPMPLPFSTAGRGSVSNTPAWGQGAVLGA